MGRTLNSLYRERRTMKNIALLSLLTLAILQPLAEAQRGLLGRLALRSRGSSGLTGVEDQRVVSSVDSAYGREALNASAIFGKADPNTITVTNNLRKFSINVTINLAGLNCASASIKFIAAGTNVTIPVGAACAPFKVVATIVSNDESCKKNVGGTTRSYTVKPNPGTVGCEIAAQ